jgi:hypothetical protein
MLAPHTVPSRRQNSRAADVVLAILRLFVALVRSVLLVLLALLEPIVWPTLSATALLTFATALFFRFAVGDLAFPFWGMIGLSLACMLALDLYYRLARLLCVRS